MSVADAGFDIESEYEAAKEDRPPPTCRPWTCWTRMKSRRTSGASTKSRIMRDAIRKVWNAVVDLPNDPVRA